MITDFASIASAIINLNDSRETELDATDLDTDANGVWCTAGGGRTFVPFSSISHVDYIVAA